MAATRGLLLLLLCTASSEFGVVSVDAATTSLIGSFTVNGQTTSVTVNLGDPVDYVCSKLDTVANPRWALQATTSGPSFSISAQGITYKFPATCAMNDVIACIATDSAGNTDTKTVQVKVQCGIVDIINCWQVGGIFDNYASSCTSPGTRAPNTTPGNGVEVHARLSVILLIVTWISSLQTLLM